MKNEHSEVDLVRGYDNILYSIDYNSIDKLFLDWIRSINWDEMRFFWFDSIIFIFARKKNKIQFNVFAQSLSYCPILSYNITQHGKRITKECK